MRHKDDQLLVTTDWLAAHLEDDSVRIVDIRGRVLPASEPPPHYFSHRVDYDEAHIPGAVFIDWTTDIVAPESPTYDIAPPDQFAALMSELGVGDRTYVIAYDDAGGMFAARLWWALNYYGHSAVSVLNGGWQKWCAENRPVTDALPRVAPSAFTPHVQPDLRVTAEDIVRTERPLVDLRSVAEYSGQTSRALRKGHIPEARNVPRKSLLEDGMLRPVDELRALFTASGIDPQIDHDAITYCNSGVSASFGLLALRVAGMQGGAVYDGSWKDWGNDSHRPIAKSST